MAEIVTHQTETKIMRDLDETVIVTEELERVETTIKVEMMGSEKEAGTVTAKRWMVARKTRRAGGRETEKGEREMAIEVEGEERTTEEIGVALAAAVEREDKEVGDLGGVAEDRVSSSIHNKYNFSNYNSIRKE